MQNALLFTGLLLGAAVLGGFIGSCCGAKRREDGGHEARIAELEERLDSLADHSLEEAKRLRTEVSDVDIRADELHDHYLDLKRLLAEQNDRLNECELLIGDTPTGGLLGRVGALEDAERHRPSGPKLTELISCVDAQADRIEEVRGELLDHLRDIVGAGEKVSLGGRSE